MSNQIQLSDPNYHRLGALANPFETPEDVIERLLDYYETNAETDLPLTNIESTSVPNELELIFIPSNEEEFKTLLIDGKEAWICLEHIDGTQKVKHWRIKEFKSTSSLRGNLFSGYLRGWKRKGIYQATISINKENMKGSVK